MNQSSEAAGRELDPRPSYLVTAKHLREMASQERHTEAVADCRHCTLMYAAVALEKLAVKHFAKPAEGGEGMVDGRKARVASFTPAVNGEVVELPAKCYGTFRTRSDENDGKEFFFHAIWHNETKLLEGERLVEGYFVTAGYLAAIREQVARLEREVAELKSHQRLVPAPPEEPIGFDPDDYPIGFEKPTPATQEQRDDERS